MRTRFFLIIFVVLVIVSTATIYLHAVLLRNERLNLVDQQVREAAVALLDSELNQPRKIEIGRVEKIISQELGENRIGKFFVIRNAAGAVLFKSATASLLPLNNVPQKPQWITIEERGRYIRVLNLALPSIDDRTLQVGLVVDQKILSASLFSYSSFGFILLALPLGMLVAWFSASYLVRPIIEISHLLSEAASGPNVGRKLPELPGKLQNVSGQKPNDELSILIKSFERLIERVNRGYSLSRFWSYQMAHELKTPMAVIEAVLNEAVEEKKVAPETNEKVLKEVFEVSETISSFLSLAELEGAPDPRRHYVIKVSRILTSVSARLSQVHGFRVQTEIAEDFAVYGHLHQLEQMVTNLIQNACIYSPATSLVKIKCENRSITIEDKGDGIPSSVLERLGQPFNRGDVNSTNRKSTGLGLAYVQSVCWLHGWKLDIQSNSSGSVVRIEFPMLNIESGHE